MTTIQEAKTVFKKAPRSTQEKVDAYVRWCELCTTIEELLETRFRGRKSYRHFFGYREMDGHPALSAWIALSSAEVDAASTPEELMLALDRCPRGNNYPENYVGEVPSGKGFRRLENYFTECNSFEELLMLERSFQDNDGMCESYLHNAVVRLYEELGYLPSTHTHYQFLVYARPY